MTQPDVAVVIPAYNVAEFLPECLDSICAQNTTLVTEIIVVDDGSSDETAEIAARYAPQVKLIQQVNQGVSAARNTGWQHTRAELVCFVDGDDWVMPDKLTQQVALLQANPHAAYCHSGWWRVSDVGKVLQTVEPWQQMPNLSLREWLLWKTIQPGALLLRRSWLEKLGGFDPSLAHSEDVDLMLRIVAHGGQGVWFRQPTVYYRQRTGSAVTFTLRQAESMRRVLDKFYALPHLSPAIQRTAAPIRYYSHLWHAWQLLAANQPEAAQTELTHALNLHCPLPSAWHMAEWLAQAEQQLGYLPPQAEAVFAAVLAPNDRLTLAEKTTLPIQAALPALQALLAGQATALPPDQQAALTFAAGLYGPFPPLAWQTQLANTAPRWRPVLLLALLSRAVTRRQKRLIAQWGWQFVTRFVSAGLPLGRVLTYACQIWQLNRWRRV